MAGALVTNGRCWNSWILNLSVRLWHLSRPAGRDKPIILKLLARLTKGQSPRTGNPVVRFNIITDRTFVVIMMDASADKLRSKGCYFGHRFLLFI